MQVFDCVRCKKEHTSEKGWRYREWHFEDGNVWGWGCSDINIQYAELTTKEIKEARQEYASDQVQSHRQGELSREFVELYPDRTEGMIKEGVISQREVERSQYVWKGDIHNSWERNRKVGKEYYKR